MGRKKKTIVQYACSNLHGKFMDRDKFLNAAIAEAVLGQMNIGPHIQDKLMSGPGLRFRRIPRMAETRGLYSYLSLPQITTRTVNDNTIVEGVKDYYDSLSNGSVYTDIVSVDFTHLDIGSYGYRYLRYSSYWNDVQSYMDAMVPTYDAVNSVITYSFQDPVSDVALYPEFSISVPPLNETAEYLIVLYNKIVTYVTSTGSINEQSQSTPPESIPYPDEWTHFSSTGSSTVEAGNTKTVSSTYEMSHIGQPGQTYFGVVLDTESIIKASATVKEIYTKTPPSTDFVYSSWSLDISYTIGKKASEEQGHILLHQYNPSNNTGLDAVLNTALAASPPTVERYYPIYPLRIDKKAFSSFNPGMFNTCYRMGKKTGLNIKNVYTEVSKQSNFQHMAYVFIRFAVGINGHRGTNRKSFAKYLYLFFQEKGISSGGVSDSDIALYQSAIAQYEADMAAYSSNPSAWTGPVPVPPAPLKMGRRSTFSYRCMNSSLGYNVSYTYDSLQALTGTGIHASMKPGWYQVLSGNYSESGQIRPGYLLLDLIFKRASIRIVHQVNEFFWEAIEISNLREKITIHRGEYVEIPLRDSDPDKPDGSIGKSEDSSLLIPLVPSILKKCGIVHYTQIATEASWVAIHAYQIVKKKKKWLKWLAVIAVIVISYFCAGTCTGLALGSIAAASTATGVIVAIGMVIGKMLVTAIIVSLIGKIAVKLFGDKIGGIIAIVAAIYISIANPLSGSFAIPNMATVFSVPNLLSMTSYVAGGVNNYYQAKAVEIGKQMEAYSKESRSKWDEIYSAMEDLQGGLSKETFMAILARSLLGEKPDSFFNRTLAVGSDIADHSLGIVTNFAEATLALPT